MRMIAMQRSAHSGELLRAPDGAASLPWSSIVETLDRHDISDGLPFIVDDDGSLTGCDRLNTYLLTAWRQRATTSTASGASTPTISPGCSGSSGSATAGNW